MKLLEQRWLEVEDLTSFADNVMIARSSIRGHAQSAGTCNLPSSRGGTRMPQGGTRMPQPCTILPAFTSRQLRQQDRRSNPLLNGRRVSVDT